MPQVFQNMYLRKRRQVPQHQHLQLGSISHVHDHTPHVTLTARADSSLVCKQLLHV